MKKSKNCIISSTSECIESSDNDNDESTKVTVAKVKMPGKGEGTKKKRIVISELSSGKEGHDTYDAMPQKKPKCVELRPFSHLVSLLNTSRYPLQMINVADIETVPLAVYSWADILKEMKWSDMDLHRVMTPDSHVIIDGKCHVVDITYESKVLNHLCAIMKENKCSSDKVDKNSIMEAIEKHAEYPIKILEYVFEKYMILNGGESSSTYRCNEEMMYKLISLDIVQSQGALSYYESHRRNGRRIAVTVR